MFGNVANSGKRKIPETVPTGADFFLESLECRVLEALIYLIYRLAVQERSEVLSRHVDQADPGLDRCPGDVGCDDAVGSAKQRIIGTHGFDAYDVAAEASQKSAVQCFADICLVNDRTSCNVKENGTWLEKSQELENMQKELEIS